MPYIKEPDQTRALYYPKNPGELNFAVTRLLVDYLLRAKATYGIQLNYAILNDVMGAVESAKQEFYRRIVVPYEELKREQNGDVYPRELISQPVSKEKDE